MKTITTTILMLGLVTGIMAQSYSETESREITFENNSSNNVFYLSNINGGITVEAYQGEKILLEAKKTVKAKSEDRLERSRTELNLAVVDRMDTIIVYVKGPCGAFGDESRHGRNKGKGWNYNWGNCEYEYDFKYDFTLKVPENMNLYISTINQGDIEVTGVSGTLNVHNVNGAISLLQVSGKTKVHTINGDVTLEYSQLPEESSSYYTLNGNINAFYPKGLKADMTFKSFNGDFYTNIEQLEYKPAVVKKKKLDKADGLAYQVDSRSAISVGGGGVSLDFETFNGDVYIKEQ